MFDFSEEKKKKYYDKAEKILKDAGLDCFQIDRARFSVSKNKEIRIYMIPFSKLTISNHQLSTAKKLTNFVVLNDRLSKTKSMIGKPIRENAYLSFKIEEEDK